MLKSWYSDPITNQWAVWRLEGIGSILIVVTTLIIILNRDSYTSGMQLLDSVDKGRGIDPLSA